MPFTDAIEKFQPFSIFGKKLPRKIKQAYNKVSQFFNTLQILLMAMIIRWFLDMWCSPVHSYSTLSSIHQWKC